MYDLNTGTEFLFEIVSSHLEVQNKAMGYKTKNYAKTYIAFSADGIKSISDQSPLGKKIIDKAVGQVVSYMPPDGMLQEYRILEILCKE